MTEPTATPLRLLLTAEPVAPVQPDVAAWWPGFVRVSQRWRDPFDRTLAGGFGADRVAWAFCAGYQAALRAMVPTLPDDQVACLCATEEAGNSPKAIRAALSRKDGRLVLSGDKKWTTLGPAGARLLVVARAEPQPGEDADALEARPRLQLVAVASDAPGVVLETMPPTRFVPEAPHAQIHLRDVAVAERDLLPGDGYERYLRPFRTIEDIYVQAAILAYVVREARARGWPREFIEKVMALLATLRLLSAANPSDPATHVLLAGEQSLSADTLAQADGLWQSGGTAGGDDAAQRWARDRALTNVAGTIRQKRRDSAWSRLAPSATGMAG
jgi:alkylation response protein AidB-like acyl-CoA dehydrogenase